MRLKRGGDVETGQLTTCEPDMREGAKVAKVAPLNRNSEYRRVDMGERARIKLATAAANADILTDLRAILQSQLRILKQSATLEEFSAGQANVLHKLAQTYALLDHATEKEHSKYDFSRESEGSLADLEAAARRVLTGE